MCLCFRSAQCNSDDCINVICTCNIPAGNGLRLVSASACMGRVTGSLGLRQNFGWENGMKSPHHDPPKYRLSVVTQLWLHKIDWQPTNILVILIFLYGIMVSYLAPTLNSWTERRIKFGLSIWFITDMIIKLNSTD